MGQKYATSPTAPSGPCGVALHQVPATLRLMASPLPPASPVVIHLRVAGLWVWVLVIDIKTCPWVLENKLGHLETVYLSHQAPLPLLHGIRLSC